MTIIVREMADSEFEIVVDHFHKSTPEFLETLGVDPSRLPAPDQWRERFQREWSRPVEKRGWLLVRRSDKHSRQLGMVI